MFEAFRTAAGIQVAVAPPLPQLLLAAAPDDQQVGFDKPLASANQAALDTDPLLRLEVEMASEVLADKIRAQVADDTATARNVLRRWAAAVAQPVVVDVLTDVEAEAVACWANRMFAALRTVELTEAGQPVTVGEPGDLPDVAAMLGIDGIAADDPATPELSMVCVVYTVVATLLMQALASTTHAEPF